MRALSINAIYPSAQLSSAQQFDNIKQEQTANSTRYLLGGYLVCNLLGVGSDA